MDDCRLLFYDLSLRWASKGLGSEPWIESSGVLQLGFCYMATDGFFYIYEIGGSKYLDLLICIGSLTRRITA